jgi:exonuclease III
VSAYHSIRGEPHGAETTSTYFMYARPERGFHIDYVFLPRSWLERVEAVEVGSPEKWLSHSDHCPLTVDVRVDPVHAVARG